MARNRNKKVFKLSSYSFGLITSLVCEALLCKAKTHHFVDIAIAAVILYTLLGLLKSVIDCECIEELHCYATTALPYIALPGLATEMWLKYNLSTKTAHGHAVIGFLMLLIALLTVVNTNMKNAILLGNAASIAYVGVKYSNYNAPVAAAIFLSLQLICFRCGEVHRENLHNFGLAAFSYFTLRSIKL